MGETVTSYSRTRTASKKIFLVIFCIGFLILSVVAALCIYGFCKVKHYQQMIADGKTATAVIYRAFTASKNEPAGCMYQYVDENGVEYIGVWKHFKTKAEAETHIGETVEIYIDGKHDSFPVGEEPGNAAAIAWVTISILLLCADTVGIVITSVKIHREREKQTHQS